MPRLTSLVVALALCACSSGDAATPGDAGAGGAAPNAGGAASGAGGASSGGGGASSGAGGAASGLGGTNASSGGQPSTESGGTSATGGTVTTGGANPGGAGGSTPATGGASAGSGGAAGGAGCGRAETPGTTRHTLDVNGMERTYLVVVPPGVTGETPVPVILGFHGGSGTAEEASQYGLTGPEAALYVYPQAPYWKEAGGVAWNVDPAGVDFPFFDALLAALAAEHCIDTSRIFAAGKSNGAFFVNELACRRPGVLRAIAPVAGGGPSTGRCERGVAAMIVHGTTDTAVRIDSGRYSREYWLARNGCPGAASTPTEPSPCVAYTGCSEPVIWCEHPGGHTFPAFAVTGIRAFFLRTR